ncbi:MAG TPA: serine protease [Thermoanaerobaculia bacterium]|nr:serine protease [Thermoanaerobaculia bacterium]
MSGWAKRFRRALLLGLAVASLPALPARAAEASAVARSVVKVNAQQCHGGTNRSATGFLWGNSSQVVTSLHVLAGCRQVSVRFEAAGATRTARIAKVLLRADLALLVVDDAPAGAPLAVAARSPGEQEEVYSYGYYLDIPTANRKTLRLNFAGRRLRDIIPAAVRRELEGLGYPDVELDVINLEGNLLPGMSGAPVVNAAGELVAIADGGLEAGLAGASWGIPVRYLAQLASSVEAMPPGARDGRVESLFAVDLSSALGIAIQCGELELQRLRTRPLAEIAASSDDVVGLQQLAAAFALPDLHFDVDVYQHLESGATMAIPASMRLAGGANGCTASLAEGRLQLHVQGSRIAADQAGQEQRWSLEVQSATALFEHRALPNTPMWVADPNWSYWQPQFRYDGLLVRRKGAALFGQWNAWNIPTEYAFETLAARGHAAIGIVARNLDNLRMQLCLRNASSVPCPPMSEVRDWARLVVTTHLATFPLS